MEHLRCEPSGALLELVTSCDLSMTTRYAACEDEAPAAVLWSVPSVCGHVLKQVGAADSDRVIVIDQWLSSLAKHADKWSQQATVGRVVYRVLAHCMAPPHCLVTNQLRQLHAFSQQCLLVCTRSKSLSLCLLAHISQCASSKKHAFNTSHTPHGAASTTAKKATTDPPLWLVLLQALQGHWLSSIATDPSDSEHVHWRVHCTRKASALLGITASLQCYHTSCLEEVGHLTAAQTAQREGSKTLSIGGKAWWDAMFSLVPRLFDFRHLKNTATRCSLDDVLSQTRLRALSSPSSEATALWISLTLQLLSAHCTDEEARSTYKEWFHKVWEGDDTQQKQPRVLNALPCLLPFEKVWSLPTHIVCAKPLAAPTLRTSTAAHTYIGTAKARLADFGVVSDSASLGADAPARTIDEFVQSNTVPRSLLEMMIFKRKAVMTELLPAIAGIACNLSHPLSRGAKKLLVKLVAAKKLRQDQADALLATARTHHLAPVVIDDDDAAESIAHAVQGTSDNDGVDDADADDGEVVFELQRTRQRATSKRKHSASTTLSTMTKTTKTTNTIISTRSTVSRSEGTMHSTMFVDRNSKGELLDDSVESDSEEHHDGAAVVGKSRWHDWKRGLTSGNPSARGRVGTAGASTAGHVAWKTHDPTSVACVGEREDRKNVFESQTVPCALAQLQGRSYFEVGNVPRLVHEWSTLCFDQIQLQQHTTAMSWCWLYELVASALLKGIAGPLSSQHHWSWWSRKCTRTNSADTTSACPVCAFQLIWSAVKEVLNVGSPQVVHGCACVVAVLLEYAGVLSQAKCPHTRCPSEKEWPSTEWHPLLRSLRSELSVEKMFRVWISLFLVHLSNKEDQPMTSQCVDLMLNINAEAELCLWQLARMDHVPGSALAFPWQSLAQSASKLAVSIVHKNKRRPLSKKQYQPQDHSETSHQKVKEYKGKTVLNKQRSTYSVRECVELEREAQRFHILQQQHRLAVLKSVVVPTQWLELMLAVPSLADDVSLVNICLDMMKDELSGAGSTQSVHNHSTHTVPIVKQSDDTFSKQVFSFVERELHCLRGAQFRAHSVWYCVAQLMLRLAETPRQALLAHTLAQMPAGSAAQSTPLWSVTAFVDFVHAFDFSQLARYHQDGEGLGEQLQQQRETPFQLHDTTQHLPGMPTDSFMAMYSFVEPPSFVSEQEAAGVVVCIVIEGALQGLDLARWRINADVTSLSLVWQRLRTSIPSKLGLLLERMDASSHNVLWQRAAGMLLSKYWQESQGNKVGRTALHTYLCICTQHVALGFFYDIVGVVAFNDGCPIGTRDILDLVSLQSRMVESEAVAVDALSMGSSAEPSIGIHRSLVQALQSTCEHMLWTSQNGAALSDTSTAWLTLLHTWCVVQLAKSAVASSCVHVCDSTYDSAIACVREALRHHVDSRVRDVGLQLDQCYGLPQQEAMCLLEQRLRHILFKEQE
eukprot:m.117385 g.117385  ORF g.117385 m.117385 type:complete len:1448 (-) comp13627_c0_seq6:315-4658(-)